MSGGFSLVVRGQIRDRASDFNGVTAVCEVMAACQGRRAVAQIHHRRPRGMGSTRRPESNQAGNGLGCCAEDHSYIEANRDTAYRYGWLVRQHETPTEVPVLRRGVWVRLDNQGGFERVPAPQGGEAA